MDINEENKRLFHAIVENEAVNKVKYGQVTITVSVLNGNPLIQTLKVNRMRRKKYELRHA